MNIIFVSSTSQSHLLPADVWTLTKQERQELLHKCTHEVVKKYQDLSLAFGIKNDEDDDHILQYSYEVLTLGLFYFGLCDSVCEGDGL